MVHWLRYLSKSSKRRLVAAVLSLLLHAVLFTAMVLFSGGRQRDPQLPDSGMYVELTLPAEPRSTAGGEAERVATHEPDSVPDQAPAADNQQAVAVDAAAIEAAAAMEAAAAAEAAAATEAAAIEAVAAMEAVAATAAAKDPPNFESLSAGLDLPVPSYPAAAKRFGQQGVVRVGIHIDTSGAVTQVEIIAASGHRLLDREVVRTVEQHWQFRPQPESVYVEREFEFRLES